MLQHSLHNLSRVAPVCTIIGGPIRRKICARLNHQGLSR